MNREQLISWLQVYTGYDGLEKSYILPFLELLTHPEAFQRHHLPGHITGSAWIVDASGSFVLLTHHAKLNKWLQPGGHADGEENVLNVALREAEEETGLHTFDLLHDGLFDIDIHTIPARKEVPEHLHYDIRFIVKGDMNEPLLVTEESHALSWIASEKLADLTDGNESIMRMVRKMQPLFRADEE